MTMLVAPSILPATVSIRWAQWITVSSGAGAAFAVGASLACAAVIDNAAIASVSGSLRIPRRRRVCMVSPRVGWKPGIITRPVGPVAGLESYRTIRTLGAFVALR